MKTYLLPILLQVMGVLVVMAEIFIPSLGILSLIAFGLFSYSLFLVFTTVSTQAGLLVTGMDLVIIPILIYIGIRVLARSSLSLNRQLSTGDGVAAQSPDLEAVLGLKGEALTDLRPAGTALIDGRRMDVVTDGDYIEAGMQVRVARVTGNQVIVQKI